MAQKRVNIGGYSVEQITASHYTVRRGDICLHIRKTRAGWSLTQFGRTLAQHETLAAAVKDAARLAEKVSTGLNL
jgi:hypothetical protein